MIKWEYSIYTVQNRPEEILEILQTAGEQGWELVSVDKGILFLKRPFIETNINIDTIHLEEKYSFKKMKEKHSIPTYPYGTVTGL